MKMKTALTIAGSDCSGGADITDFLYFIGSVFAPMIAIQIADFFILKQNRETSAFSVQNLIITIILCVVFSKVRRK